MCCTVCSARRSSPLVSELSFGLGLPAPLGIALGVAAGLVVGLIIVQLSLRFLQFHRGFSLYNIGFTAGIIGMFFMAIFSGFGIEIHAVSILSSGRNLPFSLILCGIFLALFVGGLRINHWRLKGFARLFKLPGVLPTDFLFTAGFGVTLMNMALLGLLSVAYVLVLGGELNGPVIGGIFTVVGFGAYGKHLKNVWPVIAGVTLVNILNIHETTASYTIIAALFGTTLAPIAGRYGVVAGILAGFFAYVTGDERGLSARGHEPVQQRVCRRICGCAALPAVRCIRAHQVQPQALSVSLFPIRRFRV